MSAHPTPHSNKESGSFWSTFNIVFGFLVAGFALYWGGALMLKAIDNSFINRGKEEAHAEAPAPASESSVAADAAPPAAAPADVLEITIKPDITNPLAYDTKEFTVKAGQKVKLTFDNTHPSVPQPHNICIAKPGSKDKLLLASMALAAAPDGMAKGFIPDSPDVLFHTKLLQPNNKEVLEFTAPAVGEYPYICTFPGHGAIMNGVMKVQ